MSFKMLLIGGDIMGDIPYWPPEKVTIETKDEECTEKVLKDIKVIKEQCDDNTMHIIGSTRLKHESAMNALKLIFVVLIFSTIVNMFTAGLLIYILYRLFG